MPDTAALVVALSAQLTKFEKDMKDAVGIAERHTKTIEATFQKMNDEISSQLSQLATSFSSRLGGAGSILGALGPVGTAVAVGLGAAAIAVDVIGRKVDAFVEKQKAMKEAAETMGLTLDELKAVGRAGQSVGLDFEQTEKGIVRLTASVGELQSKGTGPLFDALTRINPALTRQVAGSRDVASAIDTIAKAYTQLDTAFQKNEFVKAVFGQRNIGIGRLLDELGEKGIGKMVEALQASGKSVDVGLNERLVKTQQIINKIKSDTENLWGVLFAETIKNLELSRETAWYNISRYIYDAAENLRKYNEETDKTKTPGKVPIEAGVEAPGVGFVPGSTTGGGFTQQRGGIGYDTRGFEQMPQTVVLPPRRPGAAIEQVLQQEEVDRQLQVATEFQKRYVGVLGTAATQTEVYGLKVAELNRQVKENKDLAPAVVRATQELNVAEREAKVAIEERLGIASQEEIVGVRLARLAQDKEKYALNEIQYEQAKQKVLRDSQREYENMLVASSKVPDITRFAIDSQNQLKQFGQVAVNTFGGFENAIADVAVGATSLQDAFKKMADSIIRDLIRMALRMSITGPLSGALSGLFGTSTAGTGTSLFSGLFGGGSPSGYGVGTRQGGGPVSAGRGYIVGEHGAEFFVPSSSGTIVPSVSRGSSGGQTTVEVNNYVAADNETKQQSQPDGAGGERIIIDIVKRAHASGEFDDTNKSRFGLRPQKVR